MIHFVISCLLLSLIGVLVKSLHGSVSPFYILGFRSLAHLLLASRLVSQASRRSLLDRDLLLRVVFSLGGMALYFVSLQHNPLIVATAFFWISPVFNQCFQGKRILQWETGVPLLLIGAFVALNPGLSHGLTFEGGMIGLASSLLLGASYHSLGRASSRFTPAEMEFSFALGMTVLTLPATIGLRPPLAVLIEPRVLFTLAGVAAAATAYQRSIVHAFRQTGPELAAIFQATAIPLFSLAADTAFFGMRYSPLSIACLTTGLTAVLLTRLLPKRIKVSASR